MWQVEHTEEYREWWESLTESEQVDIDAVVEVLENLGPQMPYPYSSAIKGSRYGHMRELRIQHAGKPFRILYAFDPKRIAILLIGGRKSGSTRWYRKYLPVAERLYATHLQMLQNSGEGKND